MPQTQHDSVYVVGLQEGGCAALTNGNYFADYKHAKALQEDDAKQGIRTKIFTLSPKVAIRVFWPEGCEQAKYGSVRVIEEGIGEDGIQTEIERRTGQKMLRWEYIS